MKFHWWYSDTPLVFMELEHDGLECQNLLRASFRFYKKNIANTSTVLQHRVDFWIKDPLLYLEALRLKMRPQNGGPILGLSSFPAIVTTKIFREPGIPTKSFIRYYSGNRSKIWIWTPNFAVPKFGTVKIGADCHGKQLNFNQVRSVVRGKGHLVLRPNVWSNSTIS